MPMYDFITKFIDLEDAIIEDIENSAETTTIHFSLKRKTISCPFMFFPY